MVDILKRKLLVGAVMLPVGVIAADSLTNLARAAGASVGSAESPPQARSKTAPSKYICRIESKDGQTLYKGTIMSGVSKVVAETFDSKIVVVMSDVDNDVINLSLYREPRSFKDGDAVYEAAYLDSSNIGDGTKMIWDGLGLSFLVFRA